MLLGLKRISTALGLVAASAAGAFAQAPSQNSNQATANSVARVLKESPSLSGYRIEIETQGGIVTLTGGVANETQKAQAIALARRVTGVSGVVDGMKVVGDGRVRPAQYQQQVAMGGGGGGLFHRGGGTVADGPIVSEAAGPGAGMFAGGPIPEGPAGQPGATQAAIPGQPNFAWPSYAPYPNYSAVGYPTVYPWQAWPNIGPPSPYPEVPLDWRAVTLRWSDGIWWLDFKKHYTRPFFTPYPFGIHAY
jgi:BON domain